MLAADPFAQVLREGAVAVEPVQRVVRDGMDDAFAEVVENHDLAGEPADIRNPANHVLGDFEAVFHPWLDRVVGPFEGARDGSWRG